ncbi:MAG: co-chaperone GroES [Bdellovibrionales bacterium]|nr:co-chaperone GroES [Bdellovibrionales bacterium]
MTPLDDRLALSLKKIELRTPGGLFIPATATITEGLKQGEVIAVGSGHKDKKGKIRPMDVKIGDQVLYSNYAGSTITFMEQEIIILRESDILGVVS